MLFDRFRTSRTEQELRVMTFSAMATKAQQENVAWPCKKPGVPAWTDRKAAAIEILGRKSYDFIGLQRVGIHSGSDDDAPSAFALNLTGYGVLSRSLDPEHHRQGEGLAILYNDRNWRLCPEAFPMVWFAPDPPMPGVAGTGFLFGKFQHRHTGKTMFVYVTRLRAAPDAEAYRAASIVQLVQHIAGQTQGKSSVIVLADANLTENSPEIKFVLGKEHFRYGEFKMRSPMPLIEALQACHPEWIGKKRSQHNFDRPENGAGGFRNDMIFVSPDLSPKDADILGPATNGVFPSYHYPVTATIACQSTGTIRLSGGQHMVDAFHRLAARCRRILRSVFARFRGSA